MSKSATYTLNAPSVVAEVIDDEAIMINLDSGCYYCTDPVGGEVWRALLAGHTVGETARLLATRYEGEVGNIERDVKTFVEQLLAEGLVAPGEPSTGGETVLAPKRDDRPRFAAPRLERYADLHDLIAADPIHDVEESGWPRRKDPGRRA